ncbi:MAG TPA: tetratricopeptide repeat protein, partial [Ardenticatenaceae bacterium]|nr:tetratricopeptide repeat protein [Ardenticatenaceae bacterium]
RLPPITEFTRYEAVCLFVERAAAVLPTFRVTSHNAAALVEVCHRLDGIPLAIELAAARVKVLTVAQVAEHLNDAFRLLVQRSHAEAPRHQTLRATIDWSHELLSSKEQVLLRRLSVFAGGYSLEAVEAVCAGNGIEQQEILDLLSDLVDKSLVAPAEQDVPGGEARYRLLETLRQYSQEKLEESGEGDSVRRCHARYFLALVEAVEPKLTTREQGVWLAWLEMQHDNLRAALACARQQAMGGGAETALRLAGALWRFWSMRGYWSEGREWLESVLSLPGAAEAMAARGKALYGAGSLAYSQDDYHAAHVLLEESVAIRRALGDTQGVAMSLQHLGTLAREQEALNPRPDYTRAKALSEESLALFRELDHAMGVAGSLHDLGVAVMYQGDYAAARPILEQSLALYRQVGHDSGASHILALLGEVAWRQGSFELARSLLEESLAIRRELGYKYGIAESLGELGIAARLQGDLERAVGLLEESLALYRELGARRGIAAMLHHLGHAARDLGNHERATACLAESLALSRDLGETQRIAECLLGLAGVYAGQERLSSARRAARLLGAVEALAEAHHASLPASERADYARFLIALRGQLSEAAFTSAWAEGRAMTPGYAIEYALAAVDA